jgi:hypothetical protein
MISRYIPTEPMTLEGLLDKRLLHLEAVDQAAKYLSVCAKGEQVRRRVVSADTFGTPIVLPDPKPIPNHLLPNPAFGWTLSETAKKDIEAIERNSRNALSNIARQWPQYR